MKIVVLEHVTAAPLAERRPHLLVEGRAMRDAIAADLARLRGVGVVVAERLAAFRPLLRRADAALVIAPESDGLLESLCRVVERRSDSQVTCWSAMRRPARSRSHFRERPRTCDFAPCRSSSSRATAAAAKGSPW